MSYAHQSMRKPYYIEKKTANDQKLRKNKLRLYNNN